MDPEPTIEEVRQRQREAAARLGVIDYETDIIKIRARDEYSALDVARRLGAIEARFMPVLNTRKR